MIIYINITCKKSRNYFLACLLFRHAKFTYNKFHISLCDNNNENMLGSNKGIQSAFTNDLEPSNNHIFVPKYMIILTHFLPLQIKKTVGLSRNILYSYIFI